ncbi:MAG: hypothetical protein L3J93_02625 [Thermoplasmata archaeon]|nr:hypothetical protein [Thermoplasmata archaeon]
MYVDFSFKRSPKYRVVSIVGTVPWTEATLRAGFRRLVRWTTAHHLRTGKWIIVSRSAKYWEACLELKRPARGEGKIHVTVLPATTVATITFDPEQVSPRVIYHGMQDWLRWRRKAGEIKGVGYTREIYRGSPWTDRKAWSRATIEYAVRK